MVETRTRDISLDNIKGFIIFTVVLGHAFEWYLTTSNVMNFTYDLIYQFHMPMFIFLSGFFSKDIEKSRARIIPDLIIPYIVFESLYLVLLYFATGQQKFDLFTPQFVYWFLVSLAIYRGLLPLLIRIKFILPIMFLLGLAIGFNDRFDTFLSLSRTVSFFWFFLAGYYCTPETIARIRRLNKIGLSVLFVLALALFVFLHFSRVVPLEITMMSPYSSVDPWMSLAGRAISYFLATIIGIFLIAVFPSRTCCLTKIGQRSLIVYLFHGFFIGAVRLTNPIVSYPLINGIALFIYAVLVTWILSLDFVEKPYRKAMDFMNGKILKTMA